jgi:ZIP family zinc transporter
MFQSIVDYFTSIDPILAALYASLFTWFLTALGASFVFMFKTMNRVVLDGMLGFTGGVIGGSQFLEFIGSSHRNDRRGRFC